LVDEPLGAVGLMSKVIDAIMPFPITLSLSYE
jgi:hypothetical protein